MADSTQTTNPTDGEADDKSRRRFLTLATGAVGGLGVAVAATPFVTYFRPSARALFLGAPVQVDISKIESGSLLRVEWRGQPVYIVKRTADSLANIKKGQDLVADPGSELSAQPEYAKNEMRSINDSLLVVKGVCTHLGCAPQYLPSVTATEVQQPWFGGFFCPCHGSKFDLAGRVFKGVPAQNNLEVPPYQFLNDATLIIGEDGGAAA
ncbi:MAG: ubiquinol-cytochrome c reductase iron-sulfur subunit [Gammaproteobacteria bacterium]